MPCSSSVSYTHLDVYKRQAQVQLNIKGLKHHLAESESDQTAALVTYQYPRAGAEVPYGTTVYPVSYTHLGLVLPAEVGGMTLKKQYKYGKVLLWKYGKPRQSAGEGDAE